MLLIWEVLPAMVRYSHNEVRQTPSYLCTSNGLRLHREMNKVAKYPHVLKMTSEALQKVQRVFICVKQGKLLTIPAGARKSLFILLLLMALSVIPGFKFPKQLIPVLF